jgi:hypothetical protein
MTLARAGLLVLLVGAAPALGRAQSDAPTYLKPPQAIVDIMDAPRLPQVSVSPSRDVVALVSFRSMPSIDELARPWLGLAGSRINPINNGFRDVPDGSAITLRTIATGVERQIRVPPNAHLELLGFSASTSPSRIRPRRGSSCTLPMSRRALPEWHPRR